MKNYLLILCFFYLPISGLSAQSIPDKRKMGNDINPALIKTSGNVNTVQLSQHKASDGDLIIIDDKIYKGGTGKALKLNKDSVVFIRSIVDEESKSGINRIFFYESRKKP